MARLFFAFAFLALTFVPSSAADAVSDQTQAASASDHTAWVAQSLKRMEMIKPGMTRRDLFVVFTTEGGISNALRQTFVSRDCPYFKVDVEFEAVGRPERDAEGRITLERSDLDIIKTISRPYVQRPTND